MIKIAIIGAGKIGSLIAGMLSDTQDYEIHFIDFQFTGVDVQHLIQHIPTIQTVTLDVKDDKKLSHYFKKHAIQVTISCLPYYLNIHVAQAAAENHVHYFDLTEDVEVTAAVKKLAAHAKTAFVPQCGLAPGFVNIVGNSLIKSFDKPKTASLRVGALPQRSNQALHYSLTWSLEGVVNEYVNPCLALESGKIVTCEALEGLENMEIEGALYEAFNTSGGLGSLPMLYEGTPISLNYKTIRYPGHCQQMRFLLHELNLKTDRALLHKILAHAIPRTYQDVVIIYVTVSGQREKENLEESYFKKIYPLQIRGVQWSAIQVSTAAGVCAVVDLLMEDEADYHGFVYQEQFDLKKVLLNRFGKYFS